MQSCIPYWVVVFIQIFLWIIWSPTFCWISSVSYSHYLYPEMWTHFKEYKVMMLITHFFCRPSSPGGINKLQLVVLFNFHFNIYIFILIKIFIHFMVAFIFQRRMFKLWELFYLIFTKTCMLKNMPYFSWELQFFLKLICGLWFRFLLLGYNAAGFTVKL